MPPKTVYGWAPSIADQRLKRARTSEMIKDVWASRKNYWKAQKSKRDHEREDILEEIREARAIQKEASERMKAAKAAQEEWEAKQDFGKGWITLSDKHSTKESFYLRGIAARKAEAQRRLRKYYPGKVLARPKKIIYKQPSYASGAKARKEAAARRLAAWRKKGYTSAKKMMPRVPDGGYLTEEWYEQNPEPEIRIDDYDFS